MAHQSRPGSAETSHNPLPIDQPSSRRELNRWRFVVAGLTVVMCGLLTIAVVGLYLQAQRGTAGQITGTAATQTVETLQPSTGPSVQTARTQPALAELEDQLSRVRATLVARETELATAQSQLLTSEARRLAALAISRLGYDNEQAVLLALESIAVQSTDEGRQALARATGAYPWLANLIGHAGEVTGLAFSPDGQQLASAGSDGRLVLWALEPPSAAAVWQIADKIETRTYVPRSIAFSPDGLLLAVGSSSGSVRLYEVKTGRIKGQLNGHKQGVNQLAFSPDGARLAASSKDGVLVWRLDASLAANQPVLRLTRTHLSPYSLAFSHDGRMLAVGFETGSLALWDVEQGQLLHEGTPHTGLVHSVTFDPDDTVVVSADEETLVVQAVSNWAVNVLGLEARSVRSIALSPDGQLLASLAADRSLRLWRGCARLQRPLRGSCQPVTTVAGLAGARDPLPFLAFRPDGRWVATSGCMERPGPLVCRRGVVQLWEALPLDMASRPWHEVLATACARKSRTLTAEERQMFGAPGAGESLCPGWQPMVVAAIAPAVETPAPESVE